MKPVQLRVTIEPTDDLGVPFDRRGMTVVVPYKTHHKDFAAEVGKSVEITVLKLLGLEVEEE